MEKFCFRSFCLVTQPTPEWFSTNPCHFMTSSSSRVQRQSSTDAGNAEWFTKGFVSANPLIKNAVTSRKCEVLFYVILPPFSSSGTMSFYSKAIFTLFLLTVFLITQQTFHLFPLTNTTPSKNARKGEFPGKQHKPHRDFFYDQTSWSLLCLGPYLMLKASLSSSMSTQARHNS